jgi:hypothetical protein
MMEHDYKPEVEHAPSISTVIEIDETPAPDSFDE